MVVFYFDGTFSKLIQGQGLTAKLLSENGIEVFNEKQLEKLGELLRDF